MSKLVTVLLLGTCFLALFAVAEMLYHLAKIKAEYTRKLVHIGTGLLTLLFPVLLTDTWEVVLLCSIFFVLLLLSLKFRFLKSINNIDRQSSGSTLYPVIIIIVFLFYKWMSMQALAYTPLATFYMPVLIMAVADPAAAIAGNAYKQKQSVATGKTIAGSLVFFITANIISAGVFLYTCNACNSLFILLQAAAISVATTITERVSNKGWDNFTIPLVCCICLWWFHYLQ